MSHEDVDSSQGKAVFRSELLKHFLIKGDRNMAYMIPHTPLTHPSDLHEKIFNILQTSPHTIDWVVFYQKEVSEPDPWIFFDRQRDSQVRGPFNIDFIIYIPAYCSVICLGVENDLGNAMYALKEYFDLQEDGPLSLSTLTITAQDSQTADADQLVLLIWRNRATRTPSKEDLKLGQSEWEEVRNELEEIEQPPETIFRSDLETLLPQLLRLTDDQKTAIALVEDNPRCAFNGAAGTGKTVLAMELAKLRCEAGETVALLCSNPNLSHRFERWAKELSADKTKTGEIVAGTPATLPSWIFKEDSTSLERHKQRLDEFPELEKSLKFGYLDDKWYSFVDETVKDLGQGGIFDYLIVDEAQNLCDEVFLKLMNKLLKGGLTEGCFTMFGDFTYQNIVTHERIEDGRDALKKFIKSLDLPGKTLKNNCRNTHQIAEKVAELTDIPSPPLSGVHGPDVQIEYFKTEEELGKLLNHLVDDLKKREFRSRQIILLSSDDDGFNAAGSYGGWQLSNIREAEEQPLVSEEEVIIANNSIPANANMLRYSNIYDFQGLESDVAILVIPVTAGQIVIGGGVILPREKHLRKMLYTGMSRAKAMLIIVTDESYKKTLERRQIIGHPPSHS